MEHKDLSNTSITDERRAEITSGVHRTLDAVQDALTKAGRPSDATMLLAATKTRDVAEILAAVDAGIRCIGENRPQEVLVKAEGLAAGLADRDLEGMPFHMIGQLQANKISKILPYISTIESVDSLKLAERIARRLDSPNQENHEIGIFLEVNESGEDTKSGCSPDEAYDLALQIAQIEGLRLDGLMTIGTHVSDEEVVRTGFSHLRELRDRLQDAGLTTCRELSMGMSADMEWAIAEGSTIVRVGTGIFGERAFI